MDEDDKGQSARDGRGRGRGDRGGRGRGRGGRSRSVDISHALSRLLRHQAQSAGIALDAAGYAPLDRVLAWGPLRAMQATADEVRAVVAGNDKQRFSMIDSPGGGLIRANQGHSIPLASAGLLRAVTAAEAPVVCHGTFFAAWPAIEAAGGLAPMGRNHVHWAVTDTLDSPVPGLRKNAELLVYLDVRRALAQDPSIPWWRADNGVVLSEGAPASGVVPARLFQRVVTTPAGAALVRAAAGPDCPDNGMLTLWRDGAKVADVPPGVLAWARPGPGRAQRRKGRAEKKAEEATEKTKTEAEAEKTDAEKT